MSPTVPAKMDSDVEPERAAELIDAGAQLVDVREAHEIEAGAIAGARHIPLDQLPAQSASISRDEPVLFYCAVGSRSAMAAQAFREAGYEAFSLSGGIAAWEQRGQPVD